MLKNTFLDAAILSRGKAEGFNQGLYKRAYTLFPELCAKVIH